MGIISGALSGRQYSVEGDFSHTAIDKHALNIEKYSFKPVNLHAGEIEAFGWVNPMKILDSEVTTDKISFDEYIVLFMRHDKYSINKKILKAKIDEEIENYCQKKGKTQITKDEKKIINSKVQFELLKTLSPSTQIYESAWNPARKTLIFTNTSERINNVFCEIFFNTFGVTLNPLLPYVKVENWLEKNNIEFNLDKLLPIEFNK